MEKEALLKTFSELVDRYAKHRSYIDRARTQTSKFSAAVIEKVILDHELKSVETAEQLLPLVPGLESELGKLRDARAAIEQDKGSAGETMEELELRLAIGEISDEDYEAEGASLKSILSDAATRITAIEQESTQLTAALDRWSELARGAGQDDGRGAAAPPPPEPVAPPAPPVIEQVAAVTTVAVEPLTVQDPETESAADDEGVVRGLREDLSEVLATTVQSPEVTVEDDVVAAIEASDVVEESDPGADVDIGFDDEGAGQDLMRRSDGAEVELDLSDDVEGALPADDVGVALDLEPAAGSAEEARRALLLYQEGTAEEQIYPFTNDELKVGRGRDNDIQIKNDSKVSRFHCRLYRKGNQFFIEDNKSSNGTLVNGELITERRLFGGEEVIIGETFFRFRIL